MIIERLRRVFKKGNMEWTMNYKINASLSIKGGLNE